MKTNENQSNVISLPEINNLQEFAEGCKYAIVNYSLSEEIFSSSGFKVNKMVVFFNGCPETMNARITDIIIKDGQSLSKSTLYVKSAGSFYKKGILKFLAYLIRPILGVSSNDEIIDIIERVKDYKKGGYNG